MRITYTESLATWQRIETLTTAGVSAARGM